MKKGIKKVIARKPFSLDDRDTGHQVTIDKGTEGEYLGKRQDGYKIIIGGKTLTIKERTTFRFLFKVL